MDTEKRGTVENGRLGLRDYWNVGLSWVGGSEVSIAQARCLFDCATEEASDNGVQSSVSQQIDLFNLRESDTMAVYDYVDLPSPLPRTRDASQASP